MLEEELVAGFIPQYVRSSCLPKLALFLRYLRENKRKVFCCDSITIRLRTHNLFLYFIHLFGTLLFCFNWISHVTSTLLTQNEYVPTLLMWKHLSVHSILKSFQLSHIKWFCYKLYILYCYNKLVREIIFFGTM